MMRHVDWYQCKNRSSDVCVCYRIFKCEKDDARNVYNIKITFGDVLRR